MVCYDGEVGQLAVYVDHCPVLKYEGTTYWAFSYTNNSFKLAIVGFNSSGEVIQRFDIPGAIYIDKITVNTSARTTTFTDRGDTPGGGVITVKRSVVVPYEVD